VSAGPLLHVDGVVTGYGALRVIRDVSFEVADDEIVAIIGANGVGKTTLLNAIVGQLPIWSGTITLDGDVLSGLPPHHVVRAGIALVPEGRRVFTSLTVEENLLVGAHVRRQRREALADLDHWLDVFPALDLLRGRMAGTLSGGEQQMLALARALMSRPKVLLLDEPSLGLAPKVIANVFDFVGRIRENGTAVVLVEQNARLALGVADRAIVMRRGQIVLSGPAKELADDPRVRDVYLGRDAGRTA
jgi:branched-chain amino acid transport system ATP-binding protein